MYRNTQQSLSNYLPYLVASWSLVVDDVEREFQRRSLGKLSCFQQHLVSCVPAWWYLGWQMQHVWWPRRESFDNAAVHGSVTVHDFIVIQWISNEFGSNSVPIHLQRRIGFNVHSIRIAPNRIVSAKCECHQYALNAHWSWCEKRP